MISISKASLPLTARPIPRGCFPYDRHIYPAYHSSFVKSGAVPALRIDCGTDEQMFSCMLPNAEASVRSVFCIKLAISGEQELEGSTQCQQADVRNGRSNAGESGHAVPACATAAFTHDTEAARDPPLPI